MPPSPLHHVLLILEGQPAPAALEEEWLLAQERQLRADVEAFAAEFFTLPVRQRRERWQGLLSASQGVAPLLARLQSLKPGLDVQTEALPLDPSFLGQLVKQLLQAFPLPPLAQATSRQAFLQRIEEPSVAVHRKLWEKAARYLRAEWPALAAWDPDFVSQVVQLRRRLSRRSKMHRRSQRQQRTAQASSGKSSSWWLLWLVVCVLGGIFRSLSTTSNNPSAWRAPSSDATASQERKVFPPRQDPKSRVLIDPFLKGARSFNRLGNLPPIQELVDPAKYDVEVFHAGGRRFLSFSPHPGTTGPQENADQPLVVQEALLLAKGLSQEQLATLLFRAGLRKPPARIPQAPPAAPGPQPSPDDPTRP